MALKAFIPKKETPRCLKGLFNCTLIAYGKIVQLTVAVTAGVVPPIAVITRKTSGIRSSAFELAAAVKPG